MSRGLVKSGSAILDLFLGLFVGFLGAALLTTFLTAFGWRPSWILNSIIMISFMLVTWYPARKWDDPALFVGAMIPPGALLLEWSHLIP